jgi:hypothetical protein
LESKFRAPEKRYDMTSERRELTMKQEKRIVTREVLREAIRETTATEEEAERWIATREALWANIQKGTPTMTGENREMTEEEVKEWLAIRKEAGLHIDPETAELECIYTLTCDPYGVYPELPEEYQQVGRGYFARAPGSDLWVEFGDLPEATRDALWQKTGSAGRRSRGPSAVLIPG